MPLPSVAQLTRALKIAQNIETLEAELASLMGAAGPTNIQGNNPKESIAAKRGRPPGPAKKKRGMSEEGRQRIIEAQKKRWAEKKKADGKK